MQSRAGPRLAVAIAATALLAFGPAQAQSQSVDQDVNAAPNPYKTIDDWAKLPPGRVWGQAIGIDIDRDGKSVWV